MAYFIYSAKLCRKIGLKLDLCPMYMQLLRCGVIVTIRGGDALRNSIVFY